jgi:ribosomal protein S18 acetylase RimI-like enzyme
MCGIRRTQLQDLEMRIGLNTARVYKATDATGHVVGYALARLPFENPLTLELEGQLEELYVTPEWRHRQIGSRLLSHVRRFVHGRGLLYLTTEVMAHNQEARAFLEGHGFEPEIVTLASRDVPARPLHNNRYHVRPARTLDVRRIRSLAVETSVHSRPRTRQVEDEVLRESYEICLVDPLGASPQVTYLVAETAERQFAGFMQYVRETDPYCHEDQLKLVNVAIVREHRNRHAVDALFNRYVEMTAAAGLSYCVGEIAATNTRSYRYFEGVWNIPVERVWMGCLSR